MLSKAAQAVDYTTLGEHLRGLGRLEAAGRHPPHRPAPARRRFPRQLRRPCPHRRRLRRAAAPAAVPACRALTPCRPGSIAHVAPLLLHEVQHAQRRVDPQQDSGPHVCSIEELLKMRAAAAGEVLLAPWLLGRAVPGHGPRLARRRQNPLLPQHRPRPGQRRRATSAGTPRRRCRCCTSTAEMAAVDLQKRLEQIVAGSPTRRIPHQHLRLDHPGPAGQPGPVP